MKIAKSYITDEKGKIKSIVIDYEVYKKIEELLLDAGMIKAMEEVANDDEISLEAAKEEVGFDDAS